MPVTAKNTDQKRGQAQQRGQSAPNAERGQKTQGGNSMEQRGVGGSAGEAAPDELYGVVSVLYHALQGSQTYAQYGDDARKAGDEELVEFFETCRDEENGRAERARMLLAERLTDLEDQDDAEDDETDDEDEDDEDEDTA